MVIKYEQMIKSSVILSDNEKYRYQLKREWDITKPKAAVVMLNPSKADMLKNDKTIMNVNNYLIDKDYGSLTVVNLFTYRATDPTELKYKEEKFERLNDEFLINAFEEVELIIVGWTRDKYITRKREVEKLLINYRHKVKCFEDDIGRKPRHPRDLGENWSLSEYDFDLL